MIPSSSQITPVTADGAITEETDLVKHLRKSMLQVLHSADIDLQYKKLLETVKIVIEEFYSLHEERDMLAELFSRKVNIVLLSFGLCILIAAAGFVISSYVKSSYNGPPPT